MLHVRAASDSTAPVSSLHVVNRMNSHISHLELDRKRGSKAIDGSGKFTAFQKLATNFQVLNFILCSYSIIYLTSPIMRVVFLSIFLTLLGLAAAYVPSTGFWAMLSIEESS